MSSQVYLVSSSETKKTNDLKKGDRVLLRNGWEADLLDNKKGNIRLATVYGDFTESGSVYAWDIELYKKGDFWCRVELTEKQKKDRDKVEGIF